MDKSRLMADIEVAKEAIRLAEAALKAAIKEIPSAPRAAKIKIDDVVQAASSKLILARTNLIQLNARLAEVEQSESLANLSTARQALEDAGRRFEHVLSGMVHEPGADTTWVTESVDDALKNLQRAKKVLEELETVAAAKEDRGGR